MLNVHVQIDYMHIKEHTAMSSICEKSDGSRCSQLKSSMVEGVEEKRSRN